MSSHSRDSHGGARRTANGSPLRLRVIWRTGARTRAWDELWRRLLADVSAHKGPATADGQQSAGATGEEAE